MIIGFDTVDRRLEGTLEAPVSLLMRFCGLSADLRTPSGLDSGVHLSETPL